MAAIPDPVQTAYEAAAAQRTLSLPTIPEELRALEADDLRGGAALVAAGMMAEGTTIVGSCEYIMRGYEDICRDLSGMGACIRYVEEPAGR